MWQHEVVESNKEKCKKPMMSHSNLTAAPWEFHPENIEFETIVKKALRPVVLETEVQCKTNNLLATF